MKPTVVISIDFELAWGSFDKWPLAKLHSAARWTHHVGAPALLHVLEKHGVAATWAVVGALMEDGLPTSAESLAEVTVPWFRHPWLHYVPRNAGEVQAPEWFAPSFVNLLIQSANQEVGFHSYTHVDLAHPGTSRLRAEQEFVECRRIAERLGVRGTSFAYPRNSVANTDLLFEAGFKVFRTPDALGSFRWADIVPAGRRLQILASDYVGASPATVEPSVVDGLVQIPGSMFAGYGGGWRRAIPASMRSRRLRAGLRRVVRTGGVFHVWLHPIDLFHQHPRILDALDVFLHELRQTMERGEVRNLTMEQVAEEVCRQADS